MQRSFFFFHFILLILCSNQEFILFQSSKEQNLHISNEQWLKDKCCTQETGPGPHLFYIFTSVEINKTVHYIWNANGSQVTSREGSIIKLTECQWQKSVITCSAFH